MSASYAEDLIQKSESFDRHYDALQELGRGRFAVVKKCICKKTGKAYAAKIIKKSRTNTQGRSGREQLLLEIDILHKSNHPKMVRLYDVYETRTEMQLILEYAQGGDLHRHCIETDVARTEKEICYLIRQIVEAVRYLHDQEIVHLDLKPDNILLAKSGEIFPEIRLIDFGLSRRLNVPYSQFDIVGTPEYVAPEVLSYEPIDYGSDMWSIGVVTYVLVSGISPFAGDDVMETYSNIGMVDYDFDCEEFDEVSDACIDFIEKLLERLPKKRMTARQALEHEWLKQLEDGLTAEDVAEAQLAQQLEPSEGQVISRLVEEEYPSSSESETPLEKSCEFLENSNSGNDECVFKNGEEIEKHEVVEKNEAVEKNKVKKLDSQKETKNETQEEKSQNAKTEEKPKDVEEATESSKIAAKPTIEKAKHSEETMKVTEERKKSPDVSKKPIVERTKDTEEVTQVETKLSPLVVKKPTVKKTEDLGETKKSSKPAEENIKDTKLTDISIDYLVTKDVDNKEVVSKNENINNTNEVDEHAKKEEGKYKKSMSNEEIKVDGAGTSTLKKSKSIDENTHKQMTALEKRKQAFKLALKQGNKTPSRFERSSSAKSSPGSGPITPARSESPSKLIGRFSRDNSRKTPEKSPSNSRKLPSKITPQAESPSVARKSDALTSTRKVDSPLTNRKTAAATDEKAESPVADRKTESPVADRKTDSPVAVRKADSPVVNRKADSPIPDRKADSPVPDGKTDSPLTHRKTDSQNHKLDSTTSDNCKRENGVSSRRITPVSNGQAFGRSNTPTGSPKISRNTMRQKIPGGIAAKMANVFSNPETPPPSHSSIHSPKANPKVEKRSAFDKKSTHDNMEKKTNDSTAASSEKEGSNDVTSYKTRNSIKEEIVDEKKSSPVLPTKTEHKMSPSLKRDSKKVKSEENKENKERSAEYVKAAHSSGQEECSAKQSPRIGGKKFSIGPLVSCAAVNKKNEEKELKNEKETDFKVTVPMRVKMGKDGALKMNLDIGKPAKSRKNSVESVDSKDTNNEESKDMNNEENDSNRAPKLRELRNKSTSISRRRGGNADGSPNSPRKNYRRLYVTKVRNSKVFEHGFDVNTEAAKIMQRVDNDVLKVEFRLKSTDLKILPL